MYFHAHRPKARAHGPKSTPRLDCPGAGGRLRSRRPFTSRPTEHEITATVRVPHEKKEPRLSVQSQSESASIQPTAGVPAEFLRSDRAPEERTLIDILRSTTRQFPDAPAIDDGSVTVTYRELLEDIDEGAQWLARAGVRRGDRVGIRMPSGSFSLYVAILSILNVGAAYVPVDADDPDERADLVFGEAKVTAVVTAGATGTGTRHKARCRTCSEHTRHEPRASHTRE